MRDITKFVSKKTREENVMEKFNGMIKGKSEKKIREIEMRLLRPRPIPKYKGPKPVRQNFKRRSLKLAFQKKSVVDRFEQFIKVNKYVENNTHDVDIFLVLLDRLEKERLVWDGKKKNLYLKNRKGVKIRI
jgi:hypothetical protein